MATGAFPWIFSAILIVSCIASVAADFEALAADDACAVENEADCDISLRQLRAKQNIETLVPEGRCESWCSYQPSSVWSTQTACCGCKGATCSCTCSPWCDYQPSTVWNTQTNCCACTKTTTTTTIAPVATPASPAGESCEDKWMPSNWKADNATAACLQWSTNSKWGALKSGKTLAEACDDNWPQTECAKTCGCISTKEKSTKTASGSAPPGSTGCASYCGYVPQSAWSVQSQCCGCGGGTCTCKCASWCSHQPSTVWSTQTDCCGCK